MPKGINHPVQPLQTNKTSFITKGSAVQMMGKYQQTFLSICSDLDLEHSNPIHWSFWTMMICHQTELGCQKIIYICKKNSKNHESRRYCTCRNSHILIIIQVFTMTLTLNTATQFVCMTVCLTMMHNHSKFGYKRLSSSQNNFWTKAWTHGQKYMMILVCPTPPSPTLLLRI